MRGKHPAIRWWPTWHKSTLAEHRRRLNLAETQARKIICPVCAAPVAHACSGGQGHAYRAAHVMRVQLSVVTKRPAIDDEAPPAAPVVVDRGATTIEYDDEDEVRAIRADTGCAR